MKVLTAEKGPLEILVVWSAKGIWEPEWEPLRETQWAELLTIVHPEVMEHALRGWSRPLVLALGLPPEGALRKIPVENRQCSQRGPCPLYDPKQCQPVAKELPWCFEPEGFSPGPLKDALVRLIQIWHEAVYIVVTHAD